MKKKILFMGAAFVATAAFIPSVLADNDSITGEEELKSCVTTDNATCKLTSSFSTTGLVTISKENVTIDLNGNTITRAGGADTGTTILYVNDGGSLTLKSSNSHGGLKITSGQGTALRADGTGEATVESNVELDGADGIAAAAISGGTINLTGNATLKTTSGFTVLNDSSTVNIKDTVNITNDNGIAVIAQGTSPKVTISGGTISGTDYALASAEGSENADLEISGGTLKSSGYGVAILGNNAKFNMTNGSIESNSFALSGNGSKTTNSQITISGGTLTSKDSAAIYNPQSGDLTVSGNATINGKIGIVARQGNVKVTGGTINADGDGEYTVGDATSDGERVQLPGGVAVLVDNTENYGGGEHPAKATLGGSAIINATNENPVLAYEDEENEDGTVMIEGGVKFIGTTPSAEYLEEGLVVGPNNVVMTESEAKAASTSKKPNGQQSSSSEESTPKAPTAENTTQKDADNPNTADSFMYYVSILILSIFGLCGMPIIARKIK